MIPRLLKLLKKREREKKFRSMFSMHMLLGSMSTMNVSGGYPKATYPSEKAQGSKI